MNHYRQEMVALPAPLVFIQGVEASADLSNELELMSGSRILQLTNTQGSIVPGDYQYGNDSQIMSELKTQLQKFNVDGFWDNEIYQKSQRRVFKKYRIRFVGNSVRLPPKKEVSEEPSLLSPFHQESDLYSDGIISREWMIKYLFLQPAVFIGVYELKSFHLQGDAKDSDTRLIKELQTIIEFFSHLKTSFVPVVLYDDSTLNADRVILLQTSVKGIKFYRTSDDDVGTFVSNLLTSLESNCLDFYNAMDKRLRKKQNSGLSAIPYRGAYKDMALMARHSFKMNIVQQFKTQFQQCVKFLEHGYENMIELTRNTTLNSTSWIRNRQLLDVITIHICRAYLLLSEANIAYKKFDIHLQNVVSVLGKFYISPDASSTLAWKTVQLQWLAQLCEKCPKELVPTDRALAPIKYLESGANKYTLSSLRLPNAAFLYTSAAKMKQRYWKSVHLGSTPVKDEYLQIDETPCQVSEYIIQSLNQAVRSLTTSSVSFTRLEGSIYFRLGEEYFQSHNYAMSSSNFILALISLDREKWQHLTSVIFWRLHQCSLQLNKPHEAFKYLLLILTIEPAYVEKQIKALLKFCDWSAFNSKTFEYNYSDIQFASAEIEFDRSVAVVGQDIACRLKIRPGIKAEHYLDATITSIHCKIGGEMSIISGPFEFKDELCETIYFTFDRASKVAFESLSMYISMKNKFSLKYTLQAEQVRSTTEHLTILPAIPSVELTLDTNGPLFASQEYNAFVAYRNLENEEMKFQIEASINSSLLKLTDTQIELPAQEEVSKTFTFTAPSKVGHSSLDILLSNDDRDLVRKQVSFQVITPFTCHLSILALPSYEIESEMPEETIQEFPLTDYSRKWCLKSKIEIIYEKGLALHESNISILTNNASLIKLPEDSLGKSSNQGQILQTKQKTTYYHPFTTDKLGPTQGVLPVEAQFSLRFRTSPEGSRDFEFVSPILRQNLTLSEPRLLLSFMNISKTTMVVKYIIENPGEVTLQFLTRLIHSVDIHLRDSYFTSELTVAPKTRVEINLVGDLNEDNIDGSIKLPRLVVYDRVYQLYLPILVAATEISTASNGDFILFSGEHPITHDHT